MNKATLLFLQTVAIAASVSNFFHLSVPSSGYSSGSPHLPSGGGGRGRRDRAKAPNDGRWHMKYHRGRLRG